VIKDLESQCVLVCLIKKKRIECVLFLSFRVFEVICIGISKDRRYSGYSIEFEESIEWLTALKRARVEHSLEFTISTWSSMFGTKAKVKVESRGSNLRVEVVSLFLYSKRGCELLERICRRSEETEGLY